MFRNFNKKPTDGLVGRPGTYITVFINREPPQFPKNEKYKSERSLKIRPFAIVGLFQKLQTPIPIAIGTKLQTPALFLRREETQQFHLAYTAVIILIKSVFCYYQCPVIAGDHIVWLIALY